MVRKAAGSSERCSCGKTTQGFLELGWRVSGLASRVLFLLLKAEGRKQGDGGGAGKEVDGDVRTLWNSSEYFQELKRSDNKI